ncbi:MAG TPA: ABC transporter ATP-binding protein [Acidimicrobiales bacterium]|nr:ABC transporter ATP-binding protein [Acidimicrobiales bacterium]
MQALSLSHEVSFSFGSSMAVNSVSITVRQGEVVGLLGANGAGKTTLIRLLLGLLRPRSGFVELFGSRPALSTRRRVGYVPQTLGLYADLTVAENWRFTQRTFGLHAALPAEIAEWAHVLVGALPLGAQRRVGFAVALSHRPELLVLDEPTSGVGPLGRARLWQEVRQAAAAGAGALVTTHNMEEAEQCDRLVVMAGGSLVAGGTPGEMVAGHMVAEVSCDDWASAWSALCGAGLVSQLHGKTLRVDAPATVVRATLARGGVQANVRMIAASLEEAFVALAGSQSQHEALP